MSKQPDKQSEFRRQIQEILTKPYPQKVTNSDAARTEEMIILLKQARAAGITGHDLIELLDTPITFQGRPILPIHFAARHNMTFMLETLIRNGATIRLLTNEEIDGRIIKKVNSLIKKQHNIPDLNKAEIAGKNIGMILPYARSLELGVIPTAAAEQKLKQQDQQEEEVSSGGSDSEEELTGPTRVHSSGFVPTSAAERKLERLEPDQKEKEKSSEIDSDSEEPIAERSVNVVDGKGKSQPLDILTAVKTGRIDAATKLIEAEANVNKIDKFGRNALMRATLVNNPKVALMAKLIAESADINHVDKFGRTALSYVIESDYIDDVTKLAVVKKLIEAGVNVNHQDHFGRTALFTAAKYGYNEIVTQLIEADADIHHVDKDNHNALFHAVKNGHEDTVIQLLNNGVNADQFDMYGYEGIYLQDESSDNESDNEGDLDDDIVHARSMRIREIIRNFKAKYRTFSDRISNIITLPYVAEEDREKEMRELLKEAQQKGLSLPILFDQPIEFDGLIQLPLLHIAKMSQTGLLRLALESGCVIRFDPENSKINRFIIDGVEELLKTDSKLDRAGVAFKLLNNQELKVEKDGKEGKRVIDMNSLGLITSYYYDKDPLSDDFDRDIQINSEYNGKTLAQIKNHRNLFLHKEEEEKVRLHPSPTKTPAKPIPTSPNKNGASKSR